MQLLNKLFFLTIFIISAQASVNNTQQSTVREQRIIQMPNKPQKPTNRLNINQPRAIINPLVRRQLNFNVDPQLNKIDNFPILR